MNGVPGRRGAAIPHAHAAQTAIDRAPGSAGAQRDNEGHHKRDQAGTHAAYQRTADGQNSPVTAREC